MRSAAAVATPVGVPSDENEEPPSQSRRHPKWKDVPVDQWEDWRWQMQHAIRSSDQLLELLPFPKKDAALLKALDRQYKTAIPPYYLSLINPSDLHDPIRLQACPSVAESAGLGNVEFDDPLEEDKDSPVPGLTHRYPDRVLLVTTSVCSMYCRFCTRKRVTMDREFEGPSRDDERMIEYVAGHPEIHDCILSGGDALMLSEGKLRWFLNELAAIKHVDVIRIGTRVPVTLPQKLFDPRLIEILQEPGKVWIQTHFNHPTEITPETARACRNLSLAGLPINNHSVLLKGVNDSVSTMRELMRGLLRIKVRPYYLFHCDPVTGAGHFRTTVWKGMEIMEGLRGHISGLGVPTYVVDGLHGAGKIPIMPNYLISASENAVVLRNYEGMMFRYAPDERGGPTEGIATLGVSNVLSGNGTPLIPVGNRRMARRRQNTGVRQPTKATTPIAMRTNAATANGRSPASANGNGRALNKPAAAKVRTTVSAEKNGRGKRTMDSQDMPVGMESALVGSPLLPILSMEEVGASR